MQDERHQIFEAWIEAHKAILFKVARAYGATPADREDLFQEIALQVWHSADAFRGDSAVATWIYRVALNTALARTRNQRKHERGREQLDPSTSVLIASTHQDSRLDWAAGNVVAAAVAIGAILVGAAALWPQPQATGPARAQLRQQRAR